MQYSFVSTYSQAVACLLHVGWCVLFIDTMQLGWFGASIALNITFITTFAIQEYYVLIYKRDIFDHYRAPLFEEESFCDWPAYIKLAKRFALMCVVVTVTFILAFSFILNIMAYPIATVFTRDEETIELITTTLPILSIFIVLDAVHGVQAGNVRALGR